MIYREQALDEIYERIKSEYVALGVKTFRRTPTTPIGKDEMPCIFMTEDVDNIVEHSRRSSTGYPAKRILELVIELVVSKETNIKQLYYDLRRVIFKEIDSDPPVYNPVLAKNAFINENRTEGPNGYGVQDIVGMRLVLDLVYTDEAFKEV